MHFFLKGKLNLNQSIKGDLDKFFGEGKVANQKVAPAVFQDFLHDQYPAVKEVNQYWRAVASFLQQAEVTNNGYQIAFYGGVAHIQLSSDPEMPELIVQFLQILLQNLLLKNNTMVEEWESEQQTQEGEEEEEEFGTRVWAFVPATEEEIPKEKKIRSKTEREEYRFQTKKSKSTK